MTGIFLKNNPPDTCHTGKIVVYPYEEMSARRSPGGTGGRQHEQKEEEAVMMNDKPEELLDEALDFDDLDSVSGGAGSNNYVEADGTVSGVGESGIILVNVGGQTVNAYLSGN